MTVTTVTVLRESHEEPPLAYRITSRDRSLQKALRRIACEQIDTAPLSNRPARPG